MEQIQHVDRDLFREAMSKLAAAVNVITTDGPAGRWGMTASAVCSVTDMPPSLLVCLNTSSRLYDRAVANGVIAVNVLRHDQAALSAQFATGEAETRFTTGEWQNGQSGAPMLMDALVSFDCRISQIVPAGSHGIFIAEIIGIHLREKGGGLVYFDRSYQPVAA